MSENKKILLVDLCDTLYPHNTTVGFVNFVTGGKSKKILSLFIMKVISKLIYYLTKFDLVRYLYLKNLKGYSRTELLQLADAYITTLCPNEIITNIVDDYKQKGYFIYIVSASLDVIVESATHKLDYCGFKASELDFIDEKATGKLRKDLLSCKDVFIKDLQKKCDSLVFITDNLSDSNCIEYCNEFYAVIPKNKSTNSWKSKKINFIELK